MFCTKCGNKIMESANFCNYCGNKNSSQESGLSLNQEAFIEAELKKGIFKLENEDIASAEKIFEELALTHDVPVAWIYIGGIKLSQLDSEKATVQQALNCFKKASEILPELREDHQETYCDLSIQQIEKFYNYYLLAKRESNKATGKMWGNVALGGLSLILGNNAKNKTFGAVLGTAGAGVGAYHAGKNISQKRDAKQILSFYNETIKQLIGGVKSYCSDNREVYAEFLNKIHGLKLVTDTYYQQEIRFLASH